MQAMFIINTHFKYRCNVINKTFNQIFMSFKFINAFTAA